MRGGAGWGEEGARARAICLSAVGFFLPSRQKSFSHISHQNQIMNSITLPLVPPSSPGNAEGAGIAAMNRSALPGNDGVLVVRVLSCRNVVAAAGGDATTSTAPGGGGKRTTKASVKLHVLESNTTRRTRPSEVHGGMAEINEEVLFEGSTKSGVSASSLLEVSVSVETPTMLRSAPRRKTVGNVYIPISAFCEVGCETTSCWLPLSDGDASVKLSIFWRANDNGGNLNESALQQPATTRGDAPSSTTSPPSGPLSPTSTSRLSFLSLRRSGSSGGASTASTGSSSAAMVPSSSIKRPQDVAFFENDEQFAHSAAGTRTDASRVSVSLTVHQAKDVLAANLIDGKSDPYCSVSVRGSRGKTKVKRATLTPVWEESFVFGRVEDLHPGDQFALVVKDWDQLGRNHDLGQVLINVAEILEIGGVVSGGEREGETCD